MNQRSRKKYYQLPENNLSDKYISLSYLFIDMPKVIGWMYVMKMTKQLSVMI